ncbi:hypothetical protein [Legionella cardiaca]|uniref:Uncharacterized protein n=1 Tax=Legionella cardiaca TaxID=1071983 RepID=A0ABY8AMP8_9GAMM|nr:hypothetical protein [Legionella cardiaca]WED41930.1 hypothetical protein PXX05_08270 [Legionella cardiaca]
MERFISIVTLGIVPLKGDPSLRSGRKGECRDDEGANLDGEGKFEPGIGIPGRHLTFAFHVAQRQGTSARCREIKSRHKY